MRVLLLSTSDRGGAAKACIRLHKALLESGVESKLLILHQTNKGIPEIYVFRRKAGTGLVRKIYQRLKTRQWLKRRKRLLQDLPQCYFHFPDNQTDITTNKLVWWADVINLHWVAGFLDWESFFKKVKKPVVWTLHDMLPFTGGNHYNTDFYPNEYQKLVNRNFTIKKEALQHIDKLTIVIPSKWLGEESLNSGLFNSYRHERIPNSIDVDVFRNIHQELGKKLFNLPQDKKVILFVADSLKDNRKGFNYLTEALEQVSSDVVLLAIGGNVLELQGKSNVIALESIRDERLMSVAYTTADLFVIPSVEDNLPNTVLESLSCGTPVVGFNIGGIPDMVQTGENGVLVKEISSNALAEGIEEALATDFNTKEISRYAHQVYKSEVQAGKYINLFQELLN